MKQNPDRIAMMKDAKLLADALREDPEREEFIERLRRQFHQHGTLTPAMREALR